MTALAPLRVVELSDDVAAADCARQFVTWGEDMALPESFARAPDGRRASMLWRYVAANRCAVRLPDEPARLRGLVAAADGLVTDWNHARLGADAWSRDALTWS